ncbi:MAG: murein transglycosylase [Rhodospirillaceae bacterium]|nr:murein transglycosylase [Rhodospirillaceae bacterium]
MLACMAVLAGCGSRESPLPDDEPEPVLPPELMLLPASFSDIVGWRFDDHEAALETFLISCGAIANRDPAAPLASSAAMGTTGTWHEVCYVAQAVPPEEARDFFEIWFRPWLATNNGEELGLFTGYYEPLLNGSRVKNATYHYPLYRVPPSGEAGHERQAIDEGALDGLGLELLWVDDPVAAFFLHIQGSGRVRLPDGSTIRVGYAGQNGHAYYAIGRELIAMEEVAREDMSLQAIRDWLHANPDRADQVMWTNASYVYFTELEGPGPLGAQGVPLTPGRSLAVDKGYLAYGVPVWLETTLPDGQPWRRLMVAQDTGGAIDGPVRGDIFFGAGELAELLAGHMAGDGRTWILLPRLIGTDLIAALDVE